MNASAWFSGSFFTGLGWALFHFLWQGTLVAAWLVAHLNAVRRSCPAGSNRGLRSLKGQYDTRPVTLSERQYRRLTAAFWLIAIALGLLQAWTTRFDMNADGISYMDMGDSFLRGDWQMAVNAYWSPLYSWLLGLAIYSFKPSSQWEFPVVHLVNFLVYLLALGSFTFFLGELVRYERNQATKLAGDGRQGLPQWAWLILGYTVFLWSSLEWITLRLVTPDMCVAAFVYLASGLSLRIRQSVQVRPSFALLGLVLGFGYLTKSPLFLLGFIVLGVTLVSARKFQGGVTSALIAFAVFLAVAAPWIVALSRGKGRLTFSDTGKLVYAWYVDERTPRHWQGEPDGSGRPRHPTRKILDDPPVYEFATPVGGTYPLWYDSSYWNEGLEVGFDLGRQMKTMFWRPLLYDSVLFSLRGGFAIGLAICLAVSARGWAIGRDLAGRWFLMVPAIAAFAMYAQVHVEERFIAPFFGILVLGLYGAVRLPACAQSRRLFAAVTMVIVALWCRSVAPWAGQATRTTLRELVTGQDAASNEAGQVAEELKKLGLSRGDTVASLQYSNKVNVYWARLAKVRIVSEVYLPRGQDYEFWMEAPGRRERVVDAMRKTGARVIVDDKVPTSALGEGWLRVGKTSYGVLFLGNAPANASR